MHVLHLFLFVLSVGSTATLWPQCTGFACCMQVLGQAKNPAVIQAHLKKLFAGVHGVAMTESKDAITAALSVESEHVQLATAVPVSEQVENWLQSLLSGMQLTLQVIPACSAHAILVQVTPTWVRR